uniref:Uncharacterized protein n=1 Tax=Cryptomonas curvata TaxID=233186 RepID=A0A7S0MGQ3_9CRYP
MDLLHLGVAMLQLRNALVIALCALVVISTVTAFAPSGMMPLRSAGFALRGAEQSTNLKRIGSRPLYMSAEDKSNDVPEACLLVSGNYTASDDSAVMECIRVSMEDLRSESSSRTQADVDKSAGGSF